MIRLLYFSDYFIPLFRSIRFALIVMWRAICILVKWKKGISLISLSYANKYTFKNSYLIVRYRFKNALWFRFRGIKKTTVQEVLVLDLMNVPKLPIELVVYGLFGKKIYFLNVTPEYSLQSNSFNTEVKGIGSAEFNPQTFSLKIYRSAIHEVNIELTNLNIQLNLSPYNQIEFI